MSETPTTTAPRPHPPSCHACDGTGYVDGPGRVQAAGGRTVRYSTVERCRHDWWHDDPYDDVYGFAHPKAIEAFNAGYLVGRRELDDIQRQEHP